MHLPFFFSHSFRDELKHCKLRIEQNTNLESSLIVNQIPTFRFNEPHNMSAQASNILQHISATAFWIHRSLRIYMINATKFINSSEKWCINVLSRSLFILKAWHEQAHIHVHLYTHALFSISTYCLIKLQLSDNNNSNRFAMQQTIAAI